MRRRSYLGNPLQQIDILGSSPEFVIAHQRRKWSAAEDAELLFVDLLEQRALVEFRRALEVAQQFRLRRVEHPDLQLVAGFTLIHQVLQPAPRAFQLLEARVVQHFVQLHRDQAVDFGDPCRYHRLGVFRHRHRALQYLFDEVSYQVLAFSVVSAPRASPPSRHNLVKQACLLYLLGACALTPAFCGSLIGFPLQAQFGTQLIQFALVADGVAEQFFQLVVALHVAAQVAQPASQFQ